MRAAALRAAGGASCAAAAQRRAPVLSSCGAARHATVPPRGAAANSITTTTACFAHLASSGAALRTSRATRSCARVRSRAGGARAAADDKSKKANKDVALRDANDGRRRDAAVASAVASALLASVLFVAPPPVTVAAAGTVTYAFVRGTYERSNSVLVAVHAPLCFALAVVLLGWVFAFDGLNIKSTLTTFNVSVILLNLCWLASIFAVAFQPSDALDEPRTPAPPASRPGSVDAAAPAAAAALTAVLAVVVASTRFFCAGPSACAYIVMGTAAVVYERTRRDGLVALRVPCVLAMCTAGILPLGDGGTAGGLGGADALLLGATAALVGLNHMLEARARDGDAWDDPVAEEERSAAAEFDAALRGKGWWTQRNKKK